MYYMNLVLLKADFDGIEYQYFRGGERVNYHYLNQFTLDQLINESEVTVNGVTLKFNDDQQYIEVSYKEGGSEKYDYSLPLLGVRSIKKYLNAGDFNCDYHTCVMGSITEYDPTDNAPEMTAILFAAMIEATDADPDFMMVDVNERKRLLNIIKEYNKKKIVTIVSFTHNLEEAIYSDRLVVLNKGKIIVDGVYPSVFNEEFVMRKIGLEVPFMVELSQKLRVYNILDEINLDMDKVVSKLWK